VARKEIAVKKYVVKLSVEARERLETMVRAGKSSAQMLTRPRILVKADVSVDSGAGQARRRSEHLLREGSQVLYRQPAAPSSIASASVRDTPARRPRSPIPSIRAMFPGGRFHPNRRTWRFSILAANVRADCEPRTDDYHLVYVYC
jgi:hypothetical protein